MLSCDGISISVKDFPGKPSTFNLKKEEEPLAKRSEEILIAPLFLLRMVNNLVVEPICVKTVSNKIESFEKLSLAPESVINLSLRQDAKNARRARRLI